MFGNLLKAVVGVAVLPVDAVRDIITLGGTLSETGESSLVKRTEQIAANVDRALDPTKE